jgi:hypothetical protein
MRSPFRVFSVAEYLKAESKSELHHEYLGGQIFAIAGGSKAHKGIGQRRFWQVRIKWL